MAFDFPLAQHAATVTLNLALALAVGEGASRLWTARGSSPWAAAQRKRTRQGSLAAVAIALAASACGLWLAAAAMAEVPLTQAGEATWSMLTATHLGTAWMIGIGALVVSAGSTALGRNDKLVFLNLLALAVFLYTRSMVSHASVDGDFSALMLADWVHRMLVCLWVGAVFVSGMQVLASAPGEMRGNRDDCATYVGSLSTAATWALAGIFATGAFSAWYNLGTTAALTGDPYGAVLLAKLALVMAAAVLGGFNRFFVMPPLLAALRTAAPVPRLFTMILRAEAAVLLAVLILAAILSSTPPPAAG